jgi:hypothetical protein
MSADVVEELKKWAGLKAGDTVDFAPGNWGDALHKVLVDAIAEIENQRDLVAGMTKALDIMKDSIAFQTKGHSFGSGETYNVLEKKWQGSPPTDKSPIARATVDGIAEYKKVYASLKLGTS